MTQNDRILKYLETNRGITAREAMNALGCARLASRMNEIGQSGEYKVEKVWEEELNRFGEKTRFIRYFVTKKGA